MVDKKRCAFGAIIVLFILLCAIGSAMADEGSGVCNGVNWRITDDFTLVLGNGGFQTFTTDDRVWPWNSFRNNIKSVRFDGTVRGNGSMSGMFKNMPNLESFDTTGFDVSLVTNTEEMFAYSTISGTLDLTGWDMSHVESSYGMFSFFTGDLVMPDMQWTCLTSIYYMFNGHKGILDIPNWSFGSMTNINYVFSAGVGDVNAANWNLDGVYTIQNVFRNYAVSEDGATIDISGWHSNTLQSAKSCFAYSGGIKKIDVSNWNMPALTDIEEFIGMCNDLEQIIGLDTWDVSNITNMSMLFYWSNYNGHLDIGDISQWDTSNVTNMSSMFQSASVQNLDLSGWDVSHVTNFYGAFGSSSLRTLDISGWCDITPYQNGALVPINDCSLTKVTVGDQWRMKGDNGNFIYFGTDGDKEIDGIVYSNYWYHESLAYGPFLDQRHYNSQLVSPLAENYTPEMAGTWLREPKYYTIHFVPLYADASGEMEDVQLEAHYSVAGSVKLPENQYHLYEHEFVYWQDENGNRYGDMAEMPWGGVSWWQHSHFDRCIEVNC